MPHFSIHDTDSDDATHALGRSLATDLRGQNIFLFGDLGVGKTTFLRGLAAGLGVTEKVKSPTFVYEHIHALSDGTHFVHLDLYRFDGTPPVEFLEHLREFFADDTATVAVEWSDFLSPSMLPLSRVELHFEDAGADGRRIRVEEFPHSSPLPEGEGV